MDKHSFTKDFQQINIWVYITIHYYEDLKISFGHYACGPEQGHIIKTDIILRHTVQGEHTKYSKSGDVNTG